MNKTGKPGNGGMRLVQQGGGLAVPEHIARERAKQIQIDFLPKAWPGWQDDNAYPKAKPSELAGWDLGTLANDVQDGRQSSIHIYLQAAADLKKGQWCSIVLPQGEWRANGPLPEGREIQAYMQDAYLCAPICDMPKDWYGWYWCNGVRPKALREQNDG